MPPPSTWKTVVERTTHPRLGLGYHGNRLAHKETMQRGFLVQAPHVKRVLGDVRGDCGAFRWVCEGSI